MVGLQPSEPSSRSDIRKVEREATTVAILTIFAARATPDSWVFFQFFPHKAVSSGAVSEKNVKLSFREIQIFLSDPVKKVRLTYLI